MITNSDLTVFHRVYDQNTDEEKWEKHYYPKIWWHGGKGASTNKGYENANDVDIRIPYELNQGLNIDNFKTGDILINRKVDIEIKTQQDLPESEVFNVTLLVNNTYGSNKHIHVGGR